MADLHYIDDWRDSLETDLGGTTSSGDGGGMDTRIAKLEAHVEHIQTDITDLKTDMKDVLKRLTVIETSMATKGFVVLALMAMLAAIAALIGFTDQLQAFFGNS